MLVLYLQSILTFNCVSLPDCALIVFILVTRSFMSCILFYFSFLAIVFESFCIALREGGGV